MQNSLWKKKNKKKLVKLSACWGQVIHWGDISAIFTGETTSVISCLPSCTLNPIKRDYSVKNILSFFSIGIFSKWKESAPYGANSLPLEKTPTENQDKIFLTEIPPLHVHSISLNAVTIYHCETLVYYLNSLIICLI